MLVIVIEILRDASVVQACINSIQNFDISSTSALVIYDSPTQYDLCAVLPGKPR
jgi:hypothetical protein